MVSIQQMVTLDLMLIMENNAIMEIRLDVEVVLSKKIGLVPSLSTDFLFVRLILSSTLVAMESINQRKENSVMMVIS